MKFNYVYDEKVHFNNGFQEGNGIIKGVSAIREKSTIDMPVMGATYVVKVIDGFIPNEAYPFDTMAVAECHLRRGFMM